MRPRDTAATIMREFLPRSPNLTDHYRSRFRHCDSSATKILAKSLGQVEVRFITPLTSGTGIGDQAACSARPDSI
jgi:hypothetical protein